MKYFIFYKWKSTVIFLLFMYKFEKLLWQKNEFSRLSAVIYPQNKKLSPADFKFVAEWGKVPK